LSWLTLLLALARALAILLIVFRPRRGRFSWLRFCSTNVANSASVGAPSRSHLLVEKRGQRERGEEEDPDLGLPNGCQSFPVVREELSQAPEEEEFESKVGPGELDLYPGRNDEENDEDASETKKDGRDGGVLGVSEDAVKEQKVS
jgi:hypothetical protein